MSTPASIPSPIIDPVLASHSSPAFLDLGLGILSWKGYQSLETTLKSYESSGFLNLFDEKLLFLPEAEPRGIEIAKQFNLPYVTHTENLGILGGFKAMAEAMTSSYVVLAENDFPLITTYTEAQDTLGRALINLKSHQTQVWRFRHLKYPGQKWYIHKALRFWPPPKAPVTTRIAATLRRLIRPDKALKFQGLGVYIYPDAHQKFPRYIQATTHGDFLVDARVMNWANNVFLINRRFFLDVIVPQAEAQVGGRLINGFPTLETELNRGYWWRRSGFKIGVANPGLFTHERMNDRGY